MGIFSFLETPPPLPVDTDRAVEKTGDNDTVYAAVEEYKLLQDRISFGGHTSQDTALVENAEAQLRQCLVSAGVTLEFIQAENINQKNDDSLRIFVEKYLEHKSAELNIAS